MRRQRSILGILMGVSLGCQAASANQYAQNDGYSGAEVYAQHCARCHTHAVGGAPRPGNHEDWMERLSLGRADLLLSVLKGKRGMPPKGGNASLSVSEANAALDFMLTVPARR